MKYTAFGLLLLIMLALALETYALINHYPNDTISEVVWLVIQKRPFIPFLVGFLCGHLFWQSIP